MTPREATLVGGFPTDPPGFSDAEADAASTTFAALSDPARVKIVRRLLDSPNGSVCVCDFVDLVGLSQPAVSYHLKVLRAGGLVERERRGSFAHYRLLPGAVDWVTRALSASTAPPPAVGS